MPVEDNIFIDAVYNEEEEKYIEKVQYYFKDMGEPCRQVLTLFLFYETKHDKDRSYFFHGQKQPQKIINTAACNASATWWWENNKKIGYKL